MSTVSLTALGSPGDTIDGTTIDGNFDAFAVTAGKANLRSEALVNYQLGFTDVLQSQSAKNTSSAGTSYLGTSYTAVTHGTTALALSNITLPDGATLRLGWKQFIEVATFAGSGTVVIDQATNFKLTWDIGAGYVTIPGSQAWTYGWAHARGGAAAITQEVYTINAGATWSYHNNTGSSIAITGLRLEVLPNSTDAGDGVTLAEGVVWALVHTKG